MTANQRSRPPSPGSEGWRPGDANIGVRRAETDTARQRGREPRHRLARRRLGRRMRWWARNLAPTKLVEVRAELFWTRVRFPASPPKIKENGRGT